MNQLLVEMDGFDPRIGVILMAATNRPEILDPALLRAGRFDRQVLVNRADKIVRLAILRVHAKHVVLGPDADLEVIAAMTPGFSSADLANIINEATLLAVRRNKEQVGHSEFIPNRRAILRQRMRIFAISRRKMCRLSSATTRSRERIITI